MAILLPVLPNSIFIIFLHCIPVQLFARCQAYAVSGFWLSHTPQSAGELNTCFAPQKNFSRYASGDMSVFFSILIKSLIILIEIVYNGQGRYRVSAITGPLGLWRYLASSGSMAVGS